jgi:hypothetical protein
VWRRSRQSIFQIGWLWRVNGEEPFLFGFENKRRLQIWFNKTEPSLWDKVWFTREWLLPVNCCIIETLLETGVESRCKWNIEGWLGIWLSLSAIWPGRLWNWRFESDHTDMILSQFKLVNVRAAFPFSSRDVNQKHTLVRWVCWRESSDSSLLNGVSLRYSGRLTTRLREQIYGSQLSPIHSEMASRSVDLAVQQFGTHAQPT